MKIKEDQGANEENERVLGQGSVCPDSADEKEAESVIKAVIGSFWSKC
jgi:hypothetical protein